MIKIIKTKIKIGSLRVKRSGPWAEDEKMFIADNCQYMDFAQIAEKLGRRPDTVKKYIRDVLGKPVTSSIELSAEYSIKRSPIWNELRGQFTPDELKMFVYYWGRIINQFKDDVLPTEEMQIIDYIRIEILISRLLTQQQKNMEEILEFEKNIKAEKDSGCADIMKIQMLGDQMNMRRAAQQSISKDHKDLVQQKTSILDKMKGSRADRIKMLESSKETILGWIKEIMSNQNIRNKLGIQMAKMRLAMVEEEKRLGSMHTYVDGSKDIPLLTNETVNKYNKDSENVE